MFNDPGINRFIDTCVYKFGYTLTDVQHFIEINTLTLFNPEWCEKNRQALRDLYPDTWTHSDNLDGPPFMFKLKVAGIDWRNDDQFFMAQRVLMAMDVYEASKENQYLMRRCRG